MKLKVPEILRSEYDISPEGQFKHSFESDDGTSVSASGEIKQAVDEEGKPVNVVVVRGEYAYVDADGQKHSLSYTADEDGFHPQSADIPVAPARR
ncbi:insect cuticle protein domain-containing protein [Phthorimaea operculella]|nr:insect cuticle protein domain-containing protein [Phthorimaea operculella]